MGDIIGLVMAGKGGNLNCGQATMAPGSQGLMRAEGRNQGLRHIPIHTASKTRKNLWMCLKMLSALKQPGNFGRENE